MSSVNEVVVRYLAAWNETDAGRRRDVDTDVAQEKLDQLLKLTERYCVVYQTLKNGPPVEVSLKRKS